jgi:hypothetical protein
VITLDNHGVRWADFTPFTRMAAGALGSLKGRAACTQSRSTGHWLAGFTDTAVLRMFVRIAVILGARTRNYH